MKIEALLRTFQEHQDLQDFASELKQSEQQHFQIKGTAGSQMAFLVASIYRLVHRNVVVLLNDKEEALYFYNDLQDTHAQERDFSFSGLL